MIKLRLATLAAALFALAGEASAAYQLQIPVSPGPTNGSTSGGTTPGPGGLTVSSMNLSVIATADGAPTILTVTNKGAADLPHFGINFDANNPVGYSPDLTTCPADGLLAKGASCTVAFFALDNYGNFDIFAAAGTLPVIPDTTQPAVDVTTVNVSVAMPLAVGSSIYEGRPVVSGGTPPYSFTYQALAWDTPSSSFGDHAWKACSGAIAGLEGTQAPYTSETSAWVTCSIPSVFGNAVDQGTNLGAALGIAIPMHVSEASQYETLVGVWGYLGKEANVGGFPYVVGAGNPYGLPVGSIDIAAHTSTGASACDWYKLKMQATVTDAAGHTATGVIESSLLCY